MSISTEWPENINEQIDTAFTHELALFESAANEESYQRDMMRRCVAGPESNHRTMLIPITRFVLDATLNMMESDELRPHLHKEVAYRANQAATAARHMMERVRGTQPAEIVAAYNGVADGRDFTSGELFNTHGKDYFAAIAASPFLDSRLICGGALSALTRAGITGNVQSTVTQSDTLVELARSADTLSFSMRRYLGEPYLLLSLLKAQTNTETNEPEIDLTDIALQELRRLTPKGAKCPAERFKASEMGHKSLFRQYFHRISKFLLPPEATATIQARRILYDENGA